MIRVMAPLGTVNEHSARDAAIVHVSAAMRRAQVPALYASGQTDAEIAAKFDVSPTIVRKDRAALGIAGRRHGPRPGTTRTEEHCRGISKGRRGKGKRARSEQLSARDARIVARRREGALVEVIAAEFRLSKAMVSRICRREVSAEELRALDGRTPAGIARRTAPRVQLECDCCERTFERPESYLRHHQDEHHFCPRTRCQYEWLWSAPDADGQARRAKRAAFQADVREALLGEGLVPTNLAATYLGWSPAALRLGKARLQRREFGRVVRLGVNAREVLGSSPGPRGDPRVRGKLAKPLAALNGTERVGGPRALSAEEVEMAVWLRSADRRTWSWRKLTAKLNEKRARTGRPPVSHMTVKRRVTERGVL